MEEDCFSLPTAPRLGLQAAFAMQSFCPAWAQVGVVDAVVRNTMNFYVRLPCVSGKQCPCSRSSSDLHYFSHSALCSTVIPEPWGRE